MSTKKSETDVENVPGSGPHGVLRPVLLGFAVVSAFIGVRYLVRSIYRFHRWNW
jgi:hypothetical protein